MDIDKERNTKALEQVSFHLDEAMRLCNQLDLSGLGLLEWDDRIKICKKTIEFTRDSVHKLSEILSR